MTMLFSGGIANLAAYMGIQQATLNNASAVTIYSGTKPTAAQIISNFTPWNNTSSNLLAHYTTGYWTVPNYGTLIQLTTKPAAVNATNSGVGTWCIVWVSNHSLGMMSALPDPTFIVGDVSGPTGPGIIRFSDTTFTAGVSKSILDSSITLTML